MKTIILLLAPLSLFAQITQIPVGSGGGGGSGTVTSVATTSPITGGTISATGTIACATCVTAAASATNLSMIVGAGSQGVKISNIVVDSGLNNITLPATGVLSAPGGTTTGTAPPSVTSGTGGVDAYGEGTVPSVCATAGVDCVYADSTSHALMASYNNSSYFPLTRTICSGIIDLATGAISSGAKTSAATGACTGLLTTDNIMVDFNADPTAVTGYIPSVNGILTIIKFPTADTVNVIVENNTGSSVTPGAIRLNFRVTR